MCSNPVPRKINGKWQLTPCNNCLACRVDSLILWQARCNTEYVKHRSAFVTFTYDDLHLPYNENSLLPTLKKEQLHKYLDNISHKVKKMPFLPQGCTKNFSFFASGEYGDKFQRAHYHVLFFGLDFADMKSLFTSTWKNGAIKSLPITSGGIRYVVDYMTKHLTGEMAEKEYDELNRERPFKKCSRGLGSEFFFAHREEINDTGFIKVGSRLVQIPTYYKNLLTFIDDDGLAINEKVRLDSYKRIMAEGRSLGFDDYDQYIRYKRKSKELTLYRKFQDKGIACYPYYNNYESISDGYGPLPKKHLEV